MIQTKAKVTITGESLYKITLKFYNLVINDEAIIDEMLHGEEVLDAPVKVTVRDMSGREELDYLCVILEAKSYIHHEKLLCIASKVIEKIDSFNKNQLHDNAEIIRKGLAESLLIPEEEVTIEINSELN